MLHAEIADMEIACKEVMLAEGTAVDRARALYRLYWDYQMETSPEWATWVGYPKGHGKWTDLSSQAINSRKRNMLHFLRAIQELNLESFPEEERLHRELFERMCQDQVDRARFPEEFLVLNQLHSVHQDIPAMMAMMPTQSQEDYQYLLDRLGGIARLLDQNIALLQQGVKLGVTQPVLPLRRVPEQIAAQITGSPLDAPVMKAIRESGDRCPEGIRDQAVQIYQQEVAPAFQRFHRYVVEEYLPNCRLPVGCLHRPNGRAWYEMLVRHYTTSSLSPEEIHEIGLAETERIQKAMDAIRIQTGFDGDRSEYFEFLRKDQQFYYQRGTELLAGYRDICKRIDPELPRLFGRLPRNPYGVKPVPSYAEKSATTAYYQPGSQMAGRPGYFFANTFDLSTRPKWEMEALTLHEAVPGHHLQLALADELVGLPEFRKHSHFTAFIEGWGLYAESLGEDLGLYQDPYSKFGQLTYEMWRAVRLVVDTGMHALGWSREQAVQYFQDHTGKSLHDIQVEVDRYIVWPGQALAYKIGERSIQKLKKNAQRQLGDSFRLKDFHDELLRRGALPLDVLERQMNRWMNQQSQAL